jgi:hypothetical protein
MNQHWGRTTCMPTLFWDLQGSVLEHYEERSVMINSSFCSEMLHDKQKLVIWVELKGQLSKLLCYCMTVHIFVLLPTLLKCSSPHSDLVASEFHLFRPLINALRGHNFSSDHELKESVEASLAHQSENSFFNGILKLVECWT